MSRPAESAGSSTVAAASEVESTTRRSCRRSQSGTSEPPNRLQPTGFLLALALICTIALTGCGASAKPIDQVKADRDLRWAQYHDLFAYACERDRQSAAYVKRLKLRAREIVKLADQYPDDVFDGGERPSDRLQAMAELTECVPGSRSS